MSSISRLTWIGWGVLGLLTLASLALSISLRGELQDARSDTAALAAHLDEVEIGAGNVATQVAVFTNALGDLGPETSASFDEALVGLDEFATSQIVIDIDVSEVVTVDTEFVLDREITVPISTIVPIDETIQTTIMIDGPFDTKIPVDVEVPVQLDLPIDLEVPITINETIPIAADIPVELSVPVTIDVADTELADFADALRSGLAALAEALSGFAG